VSDLMDKDRVHRRRARVLIPAGRVA